MVKKSKRQGAGRKAVSDEILKTVDVLRRHMVLRSGFASLATNAKHLRNKLNDLRASYKAGNLSPEYQRALESIPGWSWKPMQDARLRNAELLREFIQQHGWSEFRPVVVVKGVRLGQWLSQIRRRYNRGQHVDSVLRRRLESIPGWRWKQSRSLSADERIERTAKRHLKSLKTAKDTFINRRGQRPQSAAIKYFRHWYRKGRLPPWVIQEVGKIPGWSWSPREEAWRHKLVILRSLAKRPGGLARIPKNCVILGESVRPWLDNCRHTYREGKLPPEVITELESLPGWSWGGSVDERHHRNLELLKVYLQTDQLEHLYRLPIFKGVNLHAWVKGLRQNYRHGAKQPPWLIRELETIPGWSWSPQADAHKRKKSKTR